MKLSDEIQQKMQAIQTQIDGLEADWTRNDTVGGDPLALPAEKEQLRERNYRIGGQIGRLRTELGELRKQHAAAVAQENASKPVRDGQTIIDLTARRAEIEATITTASEERAELALAAGTGDAAAKKKLDKATAAERDAITELENVDLALDTARARQGEERRAHLEKQADEIVAAAHEVADELIVWAQKLDNFASYFAKHLLKLPDLQSKLRKAGAPLDSQIIGQVFRQRAISHALRAAGITSLDEINTLTPSMRLGVTFKSRLKAAIKRPRIEEPAA